MFGVSEDGGSGGDGNDKEDNNDKEGENDTERMYRLVEQEARKELEDAKDDDVVDSEMFWTLFEEIEESEIREEVSDQFKENYWKIIMDKKKHSAADVIKILEQK